VNDEHVKDAAQDMAEDAAQDMAEDVTQDVPQDLTQDVAQDVLGAAEDGSVKVLILPIAILQWRNTRATRACRPPRFPLGDT